MQDANVIYPLAPSMPPSYLLHRPCLSQDDLTNGPLGGSDKNHTGLCALGFVLIQHNVLILLNIGPQHSICSISGTMLKCNDPFVENIDDSGIKARTQAPTMTDHPLSHLTFPPWHHSLFATFPFTNDSPYHHQCWATSPPRSASSCRAL